LRLSVSSHGTSVTASTLMRATLKKRSMRVRCSSDASVRRLAHSSEERARGSWPFSQKGEKIRSFTCHREGRATHASPSCQLAEGRE
jgi:hypothetical protein